MKQNYFLKFLLFLFLGLISNLSFGHSVQTFWELRDDGTIRFWLEHWHSDVSNSGLSTFYIIVDQGNGNENVAANGYYNNTSFASLPVQGDVNNRAQCGSANNYNDWVYYDFYPAKCNEAITITFVDGPPAATEPACPGLFSYSLNQTFYDRSAPVINATDLNVGPNNGCDYLANSFSNVSVVDNCDSNPTVVYSVAGNPIDPATYLFPLGVTTVTVEATDHTGYPSNHSAITTFEVNVGDNISPIAIAQNITVQLDENGLASITLEMIDNDSSDNCGIASMSVSPNSFTCSEVGENTVTLTVIDNNGNESTTTATVTVEDNVAGIAVAKDITVQLDETGNVSITAKDVDNGSADACGIASMSVSPNSFTCSEVGENTVTLTVIDNNGNESTTTSIVTVEDNVATEVLTQNITIQLDENGMASIEVAAIDNGSNDACGIESLKLDVTDFTCDNVGPNTVRLTATDVNGNVSSETATVTIEDNVAAEVLTQDITIQLDQNGKASIEVSDIDSGSNDACGIASMSLSQSDFDCSDIVDYKKASLDLGSSNAYIQTDIHESFATLTYEIWFKAHGLDGIQVLMDNGGSGSGCSEAVLYLEGGELKAGRWYDNCGVASTKLLAGVWYHAAAVYSGTEIELYLNGDLVNTALYTGPVMNLTSVDYDFTIGAARNGSVNYFNGKVASARIWNVDRTSTEIKNNYLENFEDETDGLIANYLIDSESGIAITDISGKGNNATLTNSVSSEWNADYPVSLTGKTVVLTVIDENGNESSETATVTVEDNVAAEVLTQDITIQLDENGMASIEVSDIDNGSNDACDIESLELDMTEFTCENVGPNKVTLSAKDVNGNVSSETATVTVEDNVAAEVLTQDITIQLDENGMASIEVAAIDNGSNDACGIESLELDMTDFTCDNVGPNTVTLTAKDVSGNESTTTSTVTIEDNVAAVAVAKDITVQLDETGNVSITAEDVDHGSADACGIASMSVLPNSFTCSEVGENTVTLTVIDNNGNESTTTSTVTVEDNVAAEVLTQSITIQLDENGKASIEVADIDNGSNDACGIESLELDMTDFTCELVGENTVTLTAKDVNGNVSSKTATVTVGDNVEAEVLTQDITIQLDENGMASIEVADIDNGSNDACGIASLELDITAFTCEHIGENTVTLTATDVNGNVSSETAILTVEDNVAAEVLTQNITIQLDEMGMASIEAVDIDNGSNDACGIESLELNMTDFTCEHIGENTVRLTATDINGNVSSKTATVTLEDTISPVAVMDALDVITAECEVNQADVAKPLAVDNCTESIVAVSNVSFPITAVGSTMITWTFEDASGNKSYQEQEVIIKDITAPVADVAQLEDLNASCELLEISAPTATDNCSGTIVGTTQDPTAYTEQGEYMITWTYADDAGNTTTQQQRVVIKDVTAPVVVTRDISVYLDPEENVTISPEDIDNGTTDDCSEVSLSLDQVYFSEVGTYDVVLTATDIYGNSSQANAQVTVEVDGVNSTEVHVVPTMLKPNSKAKVIVPFRSKITKVEIIEVETHKYKILKGNRSFQMEIDVAPFKGTLLIRVIDENGDAHLKKLIAL